MFGSKDTVPPERDSAGNKFLVMHIPKCAGTTLRLGLESHYGVDQVLRIYARKDQFGVPFKCVTEYSHDVIVGHFGVGYFQGKEHGRKVITFLRDPIDRVLSHYYYWRLSSYPHIGAKLARQLSLRDFLSSDLLAVRRNISDLQTWMFVSSIDMSVRNKYACASHDELLDIARSSISQFDYIGLTESFGDDVSYLAGRFGWSLDGSWDKSNVTRQRSTVEELDEECMELLRGVTVMDRALYDYIKQSIHPYQKTVQCPTE